MSEFSAKDLLDCATRELAMRRGVYPKFIASKRMTPEQADREIALMEQIVVQLKAEAEGWQPVHRDGDGAPAVPQNIPATLVSWYGFEGDGSGTRHPHVSLVLKGFEVKRPNAYAWRPAPPPAPLPPDQGSFI